MKYNGLDVYDITLQENDIGIKATSLVTLPATESEFLYFNKDKPQFVFSNEEKQELVGAIMIPDKLIYRDIAGQKFYVNFTKEVIKDLTGKMIKSGTAGLFTIQHQHDVVGDGVEVLEVWIKESENDKSIDFGIEENIGTAFMKVKVNDQSIIKHIKESGLNGFSIELDASIVEKNELLFKKEEPKKEPKMSIKDVFSNSVEVNGVELLFNSDLGKGAYLVSEGEDGKPVPYTGEFNLKSVIYKVENGVVSDVEDVEVSTKDAIENLLAEFTAVKDSVEAIMTSKEAIEANEAELELLKTQFEADKLAFAELKAKGISKVEVNLSKAISESGGSDWMDKFK